MQKIVLIIIIAVVLILVIWGIYFLVSGGSNNGGLPGMGSNGKTSDVQGMKVETLKEGSGPEAKDGDRVTVHYTGTLADGKKFDSSVDRNAPFSFTIGEGRVIKGWDLGVKGMKVGEKRKLTIPSDLAYGDAGFLTIPAKATLTFEIELLKIN